VILNARRADGDRLARESLRFVCRTQTIHRMETLLLVLPLGMRSRLVRARDVFEDELLRNGVDEAVAREISRAYEEANRELVIGPASLKAWTR